MLLLTFTGIAGALVVVSAVVVVPPTAMMMMKCHMKSPCEPINTIYASNVTKPLTEGYGNSSDDMVTLKLWTLIAASWMILSSVF